MGAGDQMRQNKLSHNEEDIDDADLVGNIVVYGYTLNGFRRGLLYFLSVLSLGLLWLVLYWRPDWDLKLSHTRCHLRKATKVLLKDVYHQVAVEKVDEVPGPAGKLRCFQHKKLKYIWSDVNDTFVQLMGLAEDTSCANILKQSGGICESVQKERLKLYGPNLIDIEVKPISYLIFHEALNPFYIFQIYTFVVWMVQLYWIFSSAIMLMSMVSIGVTVWEIRRQAKALRTTMHSVSKMRVCRGEDKWEEVTSECLVPGDVIEVPQGSMIECDAALLTGTVIVNESMLTGESVPVTKMTLAGTGETYSPEHHKRHTLFCGTKVLQTYVTGNNKVTALVVRTAYSTTKGELVRSILYPKPVDMKFYSDGLKFMGVSLAIGVIAMLYTAITYTLNESPTKEIVVSVLDIITFVVPPSLPACMTIGNVYGQNHLKKLGIFCLSSKYINISGTINLVAFDKTGTLTHDGLDLHGVVPAQGKTFRLDSHVSDPKNLEEGPLKVAMATCHSLVRLDGELSGDPMDLLMLESVGSKLHVHSDEEVATFEEHFTMEAVRYISHTNKQTDSVEIYGLVHQFPFISSLQRMSVLTQKAGHHDLQLYLKGAPEMVSTLCRPKTVPEDLLETLREFTTCGYRVIALAYKDLDIQPAASELQHLKRDDVETDLVFLGLLVLQNSLKSETKSALNDLKLANIRTVMVTGDNLLTAIHTARDCGMVTPECDVIIVQASPVPPGGALSISYNLAAEKYSSVEMEESNIHEEDCVLLPVNRTYTFAMDGSTFSAIGASDMDLLQQLVQKGTIFARMLPDLKVQLIEEFQDLGHIVGMCGDGANDCGALKTANTGISLSTAEASVASPFTANQPNIHCVPTLIREGRCALVTSFSLFKHLLACSWAFCIAVLILYSESCDMSDLQYLYADLILVVFPTVLFGNVEAFPVLYPVAPPPHLAAVIPIVSLVFFVGLQTVFYSTLWIYLKNQPWFSPWVYTDDPNGVTSYENTMVYCVMTFSMIVSAISYCQGPPFRKSMLTNKPLSLSLFVLLAINILMIIYPEAFLQHIFLLHPFPSMAFRVIVLLLCILDLVICLLFEEYFINKYLHPFILPKLKSLLGIKRLDEKIENQLSNNPNWPPVQPRDTQLQRSITQNEAVDYAHSLHQLS